MSGDVLWLLSGHCSCPLPFPLSISLCRSFFDRQVVLPCRRPARVQVVDCIGSGNVCRGIRCIHRNVQRSSLVCTCMSDICPMKVGPWRGCSLGSLFQKTSTRHRKVHMATRGHLLVLLSRQLLRQICVVLCTQRPHYSIFKSVSSQASVNIPWTSLGASQHACYEEYRGGMDMLDGGLYDFSAIPKTGLERASRNSIFVVLFSAFRCIDIRTIRVIWALQTASLPLLSLASLSPTAILHIRRRAGEPY
jgi:hypothetical protein